eukprot:COSAG05_NODE_277_length_12336_cov_419.763668_4_plen_690_part_00
MEHKPSAIYGATGDEILAGRLADCHDDLSLTFGRPPPAAAGGLLPPRQLRPLAPTALLDDAAVQQFITKGFVLVNLGAGDGGQVHRDVVSRLDSIRSRTASGKSVPPEWAAEPADGSSGGVPQLHQIMDDVWLRGALTSLLGPGYMLNPHHHIHLRQPFASPQGWHKDAYVFDNHIRQPRFRWVFVLYYPNDVIEAGGPTAIQPGRHNLSEVSHPDQEVATEPAELLTVAAGTCAIIDFDAWHAAAAFTASSGQRYMLKFQAARMVPPDGPPSWRHDPAQVEWVPSAGPLQAVEHDVWRWLCGCRDSNTALPAAPTNLTATRATTGEPGSLNAKSRTQKRVDRQGQELVSFKLADETAELTTAMALASTADAASCTTLCQALSAAATENAPTIFDLTPSNPHGINPHLPAAGVALAAMGHQAVPALATLVTTGRLTVGCAGDDSGADAGEGEGWLALVYALTVLAAIAPPYMPEQTAATTSSGAGSASSAHTLAVEAGLCAVEHPHFWVRRAALDLLGELGSSHHVASTAAAGFGPGVLSKLGTCLADSDRRVRQGACMALARHWYAQRQHSQLRATTSSAPRSSRSMAPAIQRPQGSATAAKESVCVAGLRAILDNASDEDDGYVRFYAAYALHEHAATCNNSGVKVKPGVTQDEADDDMPGGRWRRSLAAAEMAREHGSQTHSRATV